jgi:hypothetical protein
MVLMRRIVVRCGGGVWEDPHEQLIVAKEEFHRLDERKNEPDINGRRLDLVEE